MVQSNKLTKKKVEVVTNGTGRENTFFYEQDNTAGWLLSVGTIRAVGATITPQRTAHTIRPV